MRSLNTAADFQKGSSSLPSMTGGSDNFGTVTSGLTTFVRSAVACMAIGAVPGCADTMWENKTVRNRPDKTLIPCLRS
jgi:hypothetical protein